MAGDATKKSLSVSMIVGLLVVPLGAAAAMWLADPGASAQAVETATSEPGTDVAAVPTTTVAQSVPSDLDVACGAEGMQLVTLEKEGTINDVQQAALDALRDLCEQQGLPLPAAPEPEPIVQTVVLPAASTASTPPATTVTTVDDDDWDDDDEDDHEDDDEDDHEDDDEEVHEDDDEDADEDDD